MVSTFVLLARDDRLRVGEVSREEKMALRGTDPESHITEYTLVYEDNNQISRAVAGKHGRFQEHSFSEFKM